MSDTPENSLYRQVLQEVEPLTRFDAQDIPVRELKNFTSVGAVVHTDALQFTISRKPYAGRLPDRVMRHDSAEEMEKQAVQDKNKLQNGAIEALKNWVAVNGQSSRVPDPDELVEETDAHGHEHPCGSCQGKGNVGCHMCSGQGMVNCSSCNGSAYVNCTGCQGSGQRFEMVQYAVPATREHVGGSTFRNELRTCSVCRGMRRFRCNQCNQGQVTCSPCKGSGRLNCKSCAATGVQHELMTINSEVIRSDQTTCEDPRTEVQQQLANWKLADLIQVAKLDVKAATRNALTLQRTFSFTLPTPQLTLETPSGAVTIIGYGPQAKIVDLKGVVGKLLESDVSYLETALKLEGRWPWQHCVEVPKRLDALLESEVHQQIAEAGFRTNDPKVTDLIDRNLITSDHSTRVGRAVNRAIRKIASPYLTRWVLPIAIIPLITLILSRFFELHWIWSPIVLVASILLAWLCWWIVERNRTHSLIQAHTAIDTERFKQIIKSQQSYSRWRTAILCLSSLFWFLGFTYFPSAPSKAQRYLDSYPKNEKRLETGNGQELNNFSWINFTQAPPAVQDALAKISVNRKKTVLDQAREAIKLGCSVQYTICDLDGDGVSGYALSYSNCSFWCGSVGCAFRVYEGGRRIELVDQVEAVRPASGGVITSKEVFIGL